MATLYSGYEPMFRRPVFAGWAPSRAARTPHDQACDYVAVGKEDHEDASCDTCEDDRTARLSRSGIYVTKRRRSSEAWPLGSACRMGTMALVAAVAVVAWLGAPRQWIAVSLGPPMEVKAGVSSQAASDGGGGDLTTLPPTAPPATLLPAAAARPATAQDTPMALPAPPSTGIQQPIGPIEALVPTAAPLTTAAPPRAAATTVPPAVVPVAPAAPTPAKASPPAPLAGAELMPDVQTAVHKVQPVTLTVAAAVSALKQPPSTSAAASPPTSPPPPPPTTTSRPPPPPGGSLYCFSLMMPTGNEPLLIAYQHTQRAGIFACDESRVFSSEVLTVAPGVVTSVVSPDLKRGTGGEFKTVLNLDVFLAVWAKVQNEARYLQHDWTVKADPDTVFLAPRLRAVLAPFAGGGAGMYLNNCKFGLHGPLEVFSRAAVRAWLDGSPRCQSHFQRLCSGDCKWGEDMFIDQCLEKVLHVTREDAFRLLSEEHCDPEPGWRSCANASYVAFHPFKQVNLYSQCLGTARATAPA